MERSPAGVSAPASVPTLRDRQKATVREELRAAALELFTERGFTATCVDDIARRAGVSRSTFFRYFATKEAILAAAPDEGGDLFIDILSKRPAEEGRMQALEMALVEFAAAVRTDERRAEMLVVERIVAADAQLAAGRAAETARWRHEVALVLARRDGRTEPDLEDALAAAILAQITEHIGERWRSDDASPVRELIQSHFETFRRLASS